VTVTVGLDVTASTQLTTDSTCQTTGTAAALLGSLGHQSLLLQSKMHHNKLLQSLWHALEGFSRHVSPAKMNGFKPNLTGRNVRKETHVKL